MPVSPEVSTVVGVVMDWVTISVVGVMGRVGTSALIPRAIHAGKTAIHVMGMGGKGEMFICVSGSDVT